MHQEHVEFLRRRQFLKGSAALAALAALRANPAVAGALAQEPTSISVLSADWGGNYNELLSQIGVAYTEQNPDVVVEWEFSPTVHDEFLTRMAGGTPPDMAMTYEPNTLARLGAFIPLDDYLAQSEVAKDNFVAAMVSMAESDGKLYALPGGADYFALFYSKDIYRAAGLDPEKPPATIEEFDEYNRAILQKDASGNITRVGFVPAPDRQLLQWGYVFGGNWYDAENQRITANDPAIVAAFEWLYDYVQFLGYDQYIGLTQLPGYPTVFEPGNAFATGTLAHFFEGFWGYEPLDNHAANVDYGVALWPTQHGTMEDKANYLISGWLFGIPSGAAHADAAWEFMKFAFVDESARMGVETVNGPAWLPALPAWEEGLREVLGPDNRLTPYLGVFSETAATATKFPPPIPVGAYYSDERTRAYEAIMIGEKTPQQALDEVTKNVQAELDKALASS